ncbi:vitamin K epoxide reductase family protein [Nanoarchaeota archaeon]
MTSNALIAISSVGIILAVYLLYVEYKLKKNSSYHAVCDISAKVSCTGTVTTKYANMFKMSNALVGLVFYTVVLALSLIDQARLAFYISVPAVLFTLYLIYLTYFRLKKYCIVCHATYVVNVLILVVSYLNN